MPTIVSIELGGTGANSAAAARAALGVSSSVDSNAAYAQANAARDQANTARSDANTTFATINTTFGTVNTNITTANTQANLARDQANTAYGQANLAYAAANNANLLLGGVITGTLNVTQDIIVGGNVYLEGNTTFINVATYAVEDSLIYLASNNQLTDSVDIGFMGGKNTGGTYSHTGLARDATDAKWKLFDGLPEEGHVGNVINFNNTYLATLVANVEANTLSVVNGVSGNVNFDSGTLFVDSVANKVGIGTTNSFGILSLYGSNPDLVIQSNSGTSDRWRFRANDNDQRFSLVNDVSGYGEVFTILRAGNVGVGTTNPGYKLDVNGIVNIAQGSYLRKAFVDNTEEFLIRGDATSWNGFISYTPSGGTSNRGFKFGAWDNVGSRSDWVTFWNGNVGIGTTSPIFPLQVKTNTGTPPQALQLNTTDWTTTIGSAFQFGFGAATGNTYSEIRALSGGYSAWNNLVLQSGGGNVGIGTTSPSQRLHVAGGNFLVNNNGSGDANSGIRIVSPIATTHYNWMLAAQQNVGEAFEITPSTSVGGTTFSTPVAVFTRTGSVGIGTVSPGRRFHTYVNGADVARFEGSLYYIDIDGNGNQITGSNGLAFRGTTTGGAHLQITSGGNVGIGTSPSFKFHVFNNSGQYATWIEHNVNNAGQNFYDALFLQNANAGDDRYVQIGFSTNSSADGQHHRATIRAYRDTAATYGGKLGFFTRADGGGLNERITINAAGNVGIGVTTPQRRLDVTGSGILASFGSQMSVNSIAGIHFGYSETPSNSDLYKKSAMVFERTDNHNQGGNASGKIHFLLHNTGSTSASGTNSAVLTLDTDSNGTLGSARVGIGTVSPTNALHVNGAIRTSSVAGRVAYFRAASTNSDNIIQFEESDGSQIWEIVGRGYGAGQPFYIYKTGGTGSGFKYIIDSSGNHTFNGNMTVSGTITESSSVTLKENISPITNALDSIAKLVGVTYDRKDGSAQNRAGLIAEEVEQILPNVVNKDEEGNPTGIQYTNLIAYLVESIKELKAEIDVLKRQ